uniref:NXPE family member 3-like n=1 Tax=Salmo trutta TaxID=8032 RepID=A0A674CX57_SALTR
MSSLFFHAQQCTWPLSCLSAIPICSYLIVLLNRLSKCGSVVDTLPLCPHMAHVKDFYFEMSIHSGFLPDGPSPLDRNRSYSGGRREWHMGDQLEALVHMHVFQGRPKSYGGDILLARLHSSKLGAGIAGQVLDHRNRTYSAIFPLLWQGSAQVEVTLVHLSEERPDRVPFQSLFRSGKLSQTTVCNLCLSTNQKPLCNYTDPHTGEPWYCYKAKLLSCDTQINHARGPYVNHLLVNKEALLFQRLVSFTVCK